MFEIFKPVDGKPLFVTDSRAIAITWCTLFPQFDYELVGIGWVKLPWEKTNPN